jgi:hypothetical protein
MIQDQTGKHSVALPVKAGPKRVAEEAAESGHPAKPGRLGHQDLEQSLKESQPERSDESAYEYFAYGIAVVSLWQRKESLRASLVRVKSKGAESRSRPDASYVTRT